MEVVKQILKHFYFIYSIELKLEYTNCTVL